MVRNMVWTGTERARQIVLEKTNGKKRQKIKKEENRRSSVKT